MIEDDDIRGIDATHATLFNLNAMQVSALMHLAQALRTDESVDEETRLAASKVFDSIQPMIKQLHRLSESAWPSPAEGKNND